MKKYIIFITLLCFSISVYAQSNYVQGYIITNNQDTIKGWIDYRTDKMNGEICRFKSDSLATEQIFYPANIFGYCYTESGKFYVSKIIIIDNSPRTIFLEYLIHGIMNLYFYKDDDTNVMGYYIFEDEDGKLLYITKQVDKYVTREDYLRDNGIVVLRKDLKYRTDLNFVFGDVEQIANKLPKADFNHKTMIDFTKTYHQLKCTTGEECIEFETKVDNKNVVFKFSVYAGYEWLKYKTYYPENKSVAGALVIGGRAEFIVPRWNKSISVILDLSYAKNTGIYDSYYSVPKFEIDFGGKYTYHKGSIRPTIEGGLTLAIEKYPYNFNYAWCEFIGAGIDFRVSENNKFIFVLFDYVISNIFDANVLRLKLGYKF